MKKHHYQILCLLAAISIAILIAICNYLFDYTDKLKLEVEIYKEKVRVEEPINCQCRPQCELNAQQVSYIFKEGFRFGKLQAKSYQPHFKIDCKGEISDGGPNTSKVDRYKGLDADFEDIYYPWIKQRYKEWKQKGVTNNNDMWRDMIILNDNPYKSPMLDSIVKWGTINPDSIPRPNGPRWQTQLDGSKILVVGGSDGDLKVKPDSTKKRLFIGR